MYLEDLTGSWGRTTKIPAAVGQTPSLLQEGKVLLGMRRSQWSELRSIVHGATESGQAGPSPLAKWHNKYLYSINLITQPTK